MTGSGLYMESLSVLRDNSLLLSIAYEHLSEEQHIAKIGNSIDKNMQKLREDITKLKKEFPGKFEKEIETEDILMRIQDRAQTMLEPNDEVQKRCASGELGKELESDLISITGAINAIKELVRAEGLTYSRKDSISDLGEKLGDVSNVVGRTVTIVVKIVCIVALVAVLGFCYLFFTIEKEDPFVEEIAKDKAQISVQQEIISQLDMEKKGVSKEIKSMNEKNLSRNEKIALLDLEMEINKINEDINRAQDEIATREEDIAKNQEVVEQIRRKTILQKLFKQ